MTHEPIPAATALLLRDEPAFEVLMVERHGDISFAGGALVFPGGRIDPGDRNSAWADHAMGLDGKIADFQIASVREAFEETGILIAREHDAAADDQLIDGARVDALQEWRPLVEANDEKFLEMIRAEKLSLACDRLSLFAHWVAPPGLHKRFDTLFFAAVCPEGQEAREDGNEATEALWISPREAVAARNRNERKIIFPTVRNLELLDVSGSVREAIDFAGEREIAPVQPGMETRDGVVYLTIPDNLGYPVTEERLDLSGRLYDAAKKSPDASR